ncbi:MAG: hypothetical protein M1318_04375, partial [Firmicutes bacterium]|nr:hypothetical protein [Bacillota bacterium]
IGTCLGETVRWRLGESVGKKSVAMCRGSASAMMTIARVFSGAQNDGDVFLCDGMQRPRTVRLE